MTQVNTVRGPVHGSALGSTLMHEHIFVLSPEIEKTAAEWDEQAEQAGGYGQCDDPVPGLEDLPGAPRIDVHPVIPCPRILR